MVFRKVEHLLKRLWEPGREREFIFTCENMKIKLEGKIEEVTGADGKKHWKIADYKYSYEPDKVWIRITNLFGGDEKTSAPVLDFINQQWRVFIHSVGKPFVDEFLELMVANVNKWMASVPTDELELV
ncbi:uncharacterized protein LOC125229887 [Leguminivora glycinivorella]|uniref:uncharacterized protein LOC125229887 n=1 Tax=Leguminivora glycinivorella TaxID=1035111 RepID=UPI00200E226F|nr:uncharacterized protein LOC125229887 [Leguminivora glycinivorella]